MDYSVKSSAATTLKTACLVAGVYQGGELPPATASIDKAARGAIRRRVGTGFDGEARQTLLLFDLPGLKAERVLLVGLGSEKEFDAAAFRKACAGAAKAIAATGVSEAATLMAELHVEGLDPRGLARALVESSEHALYRFDQMKSRGNADKRPALRRLALLVASGSAATAARRGVATGRGVAQGVATARDLGNLPANVCTPSYLASEARKLGRKYTNLRVRVLSEAEIKRLGMGALWGVARGSRQTPKVVIFEYTGGRKGSKPLALVGKGVTFDAGGISLKPPAKMDEMKYDMCGAASVFGSIVAACEMKLPLNLIGITPAVENLPDGNATKPGDVLNSLSGQTIEVLNTDAEGRLILADALTYVQRYKPRAVVDIATLTGACVIALGHHASGLMSADDDLAGELLAAGERSGDRAWRLPLWDAYQEQLKSNFADFANVGGRDAGAITAGCFLSRFTKGLRWAHLDVAGTAWNSGSAKGGTGRPVSLLAEWLIAAAGRG